MEREQFERVVGRLSGFAARAPVAYRVAVLAYATFGFAVYLFLLLAALGIISGMAAILIFSPSVWVVKAGWKLGIPLCVLVWAMLRALKVSFPAPEGIVVTRQNAPELFTLIDRVSKQLAVRRIDAVLLNERYNASVVQLPRFAIFGSSSTLMLGVPLLQALSKDDVAAVLAHEFGHLSGNHSRFSGWIYRTVRTYDQLLESIGDNRLLQAFLNWYVPRLDAISFPLRRQNEYEADAAAAEVVGKERAGQTLANVYVRGASEEPFWQGINRKVHDSPLPPAQLFFDWEKRVASDAGADPAEALASALQEKTGMTDTHPSLADRLQKLGVQARVEAPPTLNAARALLGNSYDYFVDQAGLRWSAQVHEGWRGEHERLVAAAERVRELESERKSRPLTTDESFELADLSEDIHPDDDALPLFREVLARDPEHLGARFSVGRLLLARDDSAGAEMMQALAKHPEPALRLRASALLVDFYSRRGEQAGVNEHISRARAAHAEQAETRRAHEELTVRDQFVPHGLDAATLQQFREDLALFPSVSKAYLVRKLVGDELAGFVIAIELTLKQRLLDDETLAQRVADAVTLPGTTWCIRLDQNAAFEKPLKRVADSRVV